MVLQRILIEMSCMSNNDERVYFIDSPEGVEITPEILKKKVASIIQDHEDDNPYMSGWRQVVFRQSRVVLQRIVYQEEVKEGLNVTYFGDSMEEKPPEMTMFLDSFYRVYDYFKTWEDLREKHPGLSTRSPEQDLSDYIAQHYYDCMSGGMPKMTMSILHHLLKNNNLNLQESVYPGKISNYKPKNDEDHGDWYTLEDFLVACDTYHEIEPLEKIINMFRTRLPPVAGLKMLQESS